MEKILVIHHTDLDGSASGAIVKGALENKYEIEFAKYSYGWRLDPEKLKSYRIIYAVDVSFNDNPWVYNHPGLIWIDHHETVVNDHPEIPGLRRIGVGACELCWEYFFPKTVELDPIIKYLSTYDVWNKNRLNWEEVLWVQLGAINKYGNDPNPLLEDIKSGRSKEILNELMTEGHRLDDYQKSKYKSQADQFCGYIEDFYSYRVLVLNTPSFSSQAFWSLWNPEHFDIMMPWCYSPKMKKFRISMYTEKEEIDVSVLCQKFGGGGHKGAAGCQLSINQWTNQILPLIETVPTFEK